MLIASRAPTDGAHLQRVQEAVKEEAATEEEKEEIKAEVAKEVKDKMEEVEPSLFHCLPVVLAAVLCVSVAVCLLSVCALIANLLYSSCVPVSVHASLSKHEHTPRDEGAAGTCSNSMAHTRMRHARPHAYSRACAHAHTQVEARAQGPAAPAPPPASPAQPPAAPAAAAKCIDCQGLEGFAEEEGCGPLCKLERLVGQLKDNGN